MGVCSKASKSQMCFSTGFTFQGVSCGDLFSRLSLLFEATRVCFLPLMLTMFLGNMAPNLSLSAFVAVCSDTSFLLLLAGIFEEERQTS